MKKESSREILPRVESSRPKKALTRVESSRVRTRTHHYRKAKAKAEGRSRAEGVWAALVRSKGRVRSTRAIANLSLEPCLCCVRCRLKLSTMSVAHLLVLRSVFGAQSSAGSLLLLRARPGFLSALQQNSAREGNKKGGQMSEPKNQEPNTVFLSASVSWMFILNLDDDFSFSPALVGKSAFYESCRCDFLH